MATAEDYDVEKTRFFGSLVDLCIAFAVLFWTHYQLDLSGNVQYPMLTAVGYWLIYMLCKDAIGAASIGKRLIGTRLVDKITGRPVTSMQSIGRNIVTLIPVLTLFFLTWLMVRFSPAAENFIDWIETPAGMAIVACVSGFLFALALLLTRPWLVTNERMCLVDVHSSCDYADTGYHWHNSHINRKRSRWHWSPNTDHDSQVIMALAVLGLNMSATQQDIRTAYKRLCSLYHPDKHTRMGESAVDAATDQFLKIQQAFQFLTVR